MNSEPKGPIELQKMLALKRHEQPPTQFFRSLSGSVIERLQTAEPPPEPTWRQKAGLDFDAKPVLVCATGVGVCGLLLLGLISSQHVELPAGATTPPDGAPMSLVPLSHSAPAVPGPVQRAPAEATSSDRSSVEPVIVRESSPLRALARPEGPDGATPSTRQQK